MYRRLRLAVLSHCQRRQSLRRPTYVNACQLICYAVDGDAVTTQAVVAVDHPPIQLAQLYPLGTSLTGDTQFHGAGSATVKLLRVSYHNTA